jgi:hypothetical protein
VDEVRDLLHAGADPEAVVDGLSVLCLAIDAYDEPVAEALVAAGADPLRALPDGTTPLLRAVDGGSDVMVAAVLPELVHLSSAVRTELLDRARQWTQAGAEAELRRRTCESGPVERSRGEHHGWCCHWEQLTLGGVSVWDGHAGILSNLEARFGLRTPFDELVARALEQPDPDHAVWSTVSLVLSARMDEETWAAAVALGRQPDRLRRLFAADVLKCLIMGLGSDLLNPDDLFEDRGPEVLVPWAAAEEDIEVLAAVLNALTESTGPEIEPLLLSHLTHPDPRIRMLVPHGLRRDEGRVLVRPENLSAVLTLVRDPDSRVRATAGHWLAEYPGRHPRIADALAELVDHEDQLIRIYAVYGLALHDDPRCVEAERHIGPVDREKWPDTWLLDAVWRYQWRQRERG